MKSSREECCRLSRKQTNDKRTESLRLKDTLLQSLNGFYNSVLQCCGVFVFCFLDKIGELTRRRESNDSSGGATWLKMISHTNNAVLTTNTNLKQVILFKFAPIPGVFASTKCWTFQQIGN